MKVRVYEKVVSWIPNNCVRQNVIVIIIVAHVDKFEQWHRNSENNEESLIKTKKHICYYLIVVKKATS